MRKTAASPNPDIQDKQFDFRIKANFSALKKQKSFVKPFFEKRQHINESILSTQLKDSKNIASACACLRISERVVDYGAVIPLSPGLCSQNTR